MMTIRQVQAEIEDIINQLQNARDLLGRLELAQPEVRANPPSSSSSAPATPQRREIIVTTPRRREAWSEEQMAILSEMVIDKRPISEIAATIGKTADQIRNKIKTERRLVRDGKRH